MARLRLAPVEFRICIFPGCTEAPLFDSIQFRGWEPARYSTLLAHLRDASSHTGPSAGRRIPGLDPAALAELPDDADSPLIMKEAMLALPSALNKCLRQANLFAFSSLEPGDIAFTNRPEVSSALEALDEWRVQSKDPDSKLQQRLWCLNRFLLEQASDGLLAIAERTAFAHDACPVCGLEVLPGNRHKWRRTTKDKFISVEVDPATFEREERCHCGNCDNIYKLEIADLSEKLRCAVCGKTVLHREELEALIPPNDERTRQSNSTRHLAGLLDKKLAEIGRCPNCKSDIRTGIWCPICKKPGSLPSSPTYVWVPQNNRRLEPEPDVRDGPVVDPLDKYSYEKYVEEQGTTNNAKDGDNLELTESH